VAELEMAKPVVGQITGMVLKTPNIFSIIPEFDS